MSSSAVAKTVREKVWNVVEDGGCQICGEKDIRYLTWHHFNDITKILLCLYHHEMCHLFCQILVKILAKKKQIKEEELVQIMINRSKNKLKLHFLPYEDIQKMIKKVISYLKKGRVIKNESGTVLSIANYRSLSRFLNFKSYKKTLRENCYENCLIAALPLTSLQDKKELMRSIWILKGNVTPKNKNKVCSLCFAEKCSRKQQKAMFFI